MAGNEKVILDAGHGGDEPGAIYNGRKEKDDTLRLTLAVGRILEENGVSTLYTRTTDVYNSPQEKAEIANRSGQICLFLSIGMQCRFRGQEGELPFWYMKILGLQQFWRKIF